MEVKKRKTKDVKTYRTLFFLVGMCVSVGTVYGLMEYKKYEPVEVNQIDMVWEETMVEVEQTQLKEEPKKEIKTNDVVLKLVPDEIIIDIDVIIDIEPNEDPNPTADIIIKDEGPIDTDEPLPWYAVQQTAGFPGGDAAMDRFIDENLYVSDIASDEASSGTVLVAFTVEKDGSLSNIKVASKRKIGYGVEEEVLKVFKKMPKWSPALQRDKPVRMSFSKPVRLNFN